MQKEPKLQTQVEAVIHYFSNMDIEMIDLILGNNLTYQDFPKYKFIQKLAIVFEEFAQYGDTFLHHHRGICMGCNSGCSGLSFIGNKSQNYIDMIIEAKGDKVIDMYECTLFTNDDDNIFKNKPIFIDKSY